ncbi:MAG: hypothetical protein Q8R07_00610 [Candidatus Uhrbacteria bacterium]|nr:hypothetical protein [Candidatus Uhrbacteria bacterium]
MEKPEGTFRDHSQPRSGTRGVFYFLGAIVFIGWLYIFFMSDLFVINSVEVQGARSLDAIDVSREVLQILDERPVRRPWPARHAWFVDKPHLIRELSQRLFVTNASVDKTYLNVLRLKMEEQTRKFIFHSHQQYVWVDLQGTVLHELMPDERQRAQARILGSKLPTPDDPPMFHRDLDDRVVIGQSVADASTVKAWLQIASETILEGMKYREFDLPKTSTSSRAILKSAEGESVVIDVMEPIGPQIRAYLVFKESQPKNIKAIQYIDVRIPGKVYVK